jgi:glc operon protein GlcG
METLTLKEAQAAVAAVLETAQRDGGKPVCAVVVDRAGELVCLGRMDGAPVRTLHFSMSKAYTSAYMEKDSGEVGDSLRESRRTLDWYGNPRLTGIAGGAVVRKNNYTVGGIGISGRPSDKDLELAKLGLSALLKA